MIKNAVITGIFIIFGNEKAYNVTNPLSFKDMTSILGGAKLLGDGGC